MEENIKETININDTVMVSSGCNFIYGHVVDIMEDGKKYKVIPDLGYHTSKPHFKLKEYYIVDENKIAPITDRSKK